MGPAERVYERSGRFLSRVIDGEAVLVPTASSLSEMSRIYRLDPVGTWIWERLDGRTPVPELLRRQAEAFAVGGADPAGDLDAFLKELLALGAVREVPGP